MAKALSRFPGFEVNTCAATSDPVITASADGVHVAVISADIHDGAQKGNTIIRKLRLTHPAIRSIMLLNSVERTAVVEAFQSGARGIFCRNNSFKSLCKCIRQVHVGQVWANSDELRYVLDALSQPSTPSLMDNQGKTLLTKRQSQIVSALSQGLSNREIAVRMKLSEHTVKNYLFRIFNKLGVSSRVELILYALSQQRSASGSSELSQ